MGLATGGVWSSAPEDQIIISLLIIKNIILYSMTGPCKSFTQKIYFFKKIMGFRGLASGGVWGSAPEDKII
jgi:hypothetical protein